MSKRKITAYARRALEAIGKNTVPGQPPVHRTKTKAGFFGGKGRALPDAGTQELIGMGVLVSNDDGLFPGDTQTFRLDLAAWQAAQ